MLRQLRRILNKLIFCWLHLKADASMKITTLLLFVLGLFSFSAYSQNLYTLPNAANITNEVNATTGWSGPASIASVTDNPQNGTYSLRITTNSNGNRYSAFNFTATVGTVYNISIWARRGTNNSNSAFSSWQGFSGFIETSIATTGWLEYTFTLTATSSNPQIRVYGSTGGPAGRTAYVDAITITAQAPDTEPPTAPSNLTSSNTSSTATTLTWNASTDNVGVVSYQIRQNNTTIGTVSGTTLTYTATGLTASTTYSFNVVALDAANNVSQPSNTVQVTTLAGGDTQPPTAPSNLAATNTTSTGTTLNWNASTDNVGVVSYQIRQNNVMVGTVSGTTLTYTATGLTASTTYSFNVVALDAANNVSQPSNTVQVTTLSGGDIQAPTAPSNLAATNTTSSATTLSWNASTDNVGVVSYQIRQNTVTVGTVSGTTLTYTAGGLSASTTYSFNVVALDAANNVSPPSNTVQVTTLTGGTGTPYTTTNANLPTVNWQAANLYVSGGMGIGTAAPNITNYRLAVNGTIRTKEFLVQPGWSDFVFEPGYYLMTPTEVEDYIIKNGHLKDIPPASEVQENGIGLGELNMRLLQKVEELTLYIIEMNKKLELLEKAKAEKLKY